MTAHWPSPWRAGEMTGCMAGSAIGGVVMVGCGVSWLAGGVVANGVGNSNGVSGCLLVSWYCHCWSVSVAFKYHASIWAVTVGPATARKVSAIQAPTVPFP